MNYRIGGHNVRITAEHGYEMLDKLLPSFKPFETTEAIPGEPFLTMSLQRSIKPVPQELLRHITDADTGNGVIKVERMEEGTYQFTICNVSGTPCALLQTASDFSDCRCAIRGDLGTKRFALNGAMMLVYAFRGALSDTLLIHASVVRHKGRAYAFTAASGTGKSTQASNWLNNIEGCDLINDDNPIVRYLNGKSVLYGSPWSGKTACYRNVMVPLGAIMKIERDTVNHVTPLSTLETFGTLLTACSAIRTDEKVYGSLCDVVSKVIGTITMATLHCLPDAASAEVCRCYLEEGDERQKKEK